MKLRFLGQNYSFNSVVVETIPSDTIARFRGQSYALRRPLQRFKSPVGIRQYRGVVYLRG